MQNSMVSTTPLDPCACETSAQGGNRRRKDGPSFTRLAALCDMMEASSGQVWLAPMTRTIEVRLALALFASTYVPACERRGEKDRLGFGGGGADGSSFKSAPYRSR